MSKIKELQKLYPHFDRSFIDVISDILPVKYLETYLRLINEKFASRVDGYYLDSLESEMKDSWNLPQNFLKDKTQAQLLADFGLLDMVTSRDDFKTMCEFANLNERKLIKNNDLRSYTSFSEMVLQISVCHMKTMDKDLEKEIETVYEDNEWKLLKPLSWMASKKYGAGTKWCTSMEKDSTSFVRYSRRGILIYCINKLSGYKVGAFKSLDLMSEKETSFWSASDVRIDSMETNLPQFILDIFKLQFSTSLLTNWELFSDSSKNTLMSIVRKMDQGELDDYQLADLRTLENELTRPVVTQYHSQHDNIKLPWDTDASNTSVA